MQIYTRIFPMVKFCQIVEAVAQRCSVKKVFIEISQDSQENLCARILISIKLQASGNTLAASVRRILLLSKNWLFCKKAKSCIFDRVLNKPPI